MPDDPLSGLQQFTLALAYFHHLNPHLHEGEHRADVYSYEVMAVRWGFRTTDGRQLHVWSKRAPTRPLLPKARLGPRYQAARVAVSKAFRRLEQRGVAQRGVYPDAEGHRALGLVLTPGGRPLAQRALNTLSPQWRAHYEAMQRQEEPLVRKR